MSRSLAVTLCTILLAACAQVRDITGGEKDTLGPVLLSAEPPNYSTRFEGERILLRFNERIVLERVRDRLLISPPLEVPPTVAVVHGTDVELVLRSPLRASTTYTFSIGEVVKDLTEGNFAAGIDYVLSTGATMDSLAAAGSVHDAFTGVPCKDVLVMLHPVNDTTNFKNHAPNYATRTDTAGRFVLEHLRSGNYDLVALRDQNANYRYDLPNEEIAFASGPVRATVIDSTYIPEELRLFREASPLQSVREAMVEPDGAWRIVLARPAQQLVLTDLARRGGSLSWDPEWNTTRDTVRLWPSDTTALAEGRYELTTEAGPLDTIRYRAVRKMPYYTNLDMVAQEEADGLVVHLMATRPISGLDRTRFQLTQDSASVPFALVEDSTNNRHLVLTPMMGPGARAQLVVLPKAVRDIYGGHNDTLAFGIGRAAEDRTGTLRVVVERTPAVRGEVRIQLLDQQNQVVRDAPLDSNGMVRWDRISPGNHRLRMIDDLNANGRWDTGDWISGLQPEPVRYHHEPLNIRAAWDLGVTWKVERP